MGVARIDWGLGCESLDRSKADSEKGSEFHNETLEPRRESRKAPGFVRHLGSGPPPAREQEQGSDEQDRRKKRKDRGGEPAEPEGAMPGGDAENEDSGVVPHGQDIQPKLVPSQAWRWSWRLPNVAPRSRILNSPNFDLQEREEGKPGQKRMLQDSSKERPQGFGARAAKAINADRQARLRRHHHQGSDDGPEGGERDELS